MKIVTFGQVIIGCDAIKVTGWNVMREPGDPKEATTEQLILGFAIHWAQQRMSDEVKKAVFDVFRENAKKMLAEKPVTGKPN